MCENSVHNSQGVSYIVDGDISHRYVEELLISYNACEVHYVIVPPPLPPHLFRPLGRCVCVCVLMCLFKLIRMHVRVICMYTCVNVFI